jgi:hypothetical protein
LNTHRPLPGTRTELDIQAYETTMHLVNSYVIFPLAVRFRPTDPKDYVYGMRGVTGVSTVPDYSSGKSVALVYQEFVAGWFLALAKDLEDGRRFLYDLWFLEFSGFGGLWNRIPGLPSWAPNFAGVANSGGVSFHVRSHKVVKKIPSDELTLPTVESSVLFCKAIVVDTISDLSPVGIMSDASRLWMFDYATGSSKTLTTRTAILYDMALIIFCRKTPPSPEISDLYLRLLIADLESTNDESSPLSSDKSFDQPEVDPPLPPIPDALDLHRENKRHYVRRVAMLHDTFSKKETTHQAADASGLATMHTKWRCKRRIPCAWASRAREDWVCSTHSSKAETLYAC